MCTVSMSTEPGEVVQGKTEGETPEDLIGWFQSTIKDYDATFIIYYRGLW
jgi:hypothetical protein